MILATSRGPVAVRSSTLGQLIESRGGGRTAGVHVSGRTVAGLPAAGAAIVFAALAVASLKMRVWRGEGLERARVRDSWQARFFAGAPNEREPWVSVWAKTEGCLTARNSAYWLKAKDKAGRVVAVYPIAPDCVTVGFDREKHQPRYRVQVDAAGGWSDWLGPDYILHFRGLGDPAEANALVPRTPIEIYRDSLGAALAKVKYETGFYEEGVHQKLAVTFPKEVGADEARTWRDLAQADQGGLANAHGIRVFGGGAELTTYGLSLADSQFIESIQLSVEDAGRIYRVLSSLIGGGSQSQVSKPISPEHETTRWLRQLGPRLDWIEGFIASDPDFFGPGSRDLPGFDQTGVLRGDLATEANIALKKVQSGQWLVDEARAKDGLPPLPNGQGQIPQIIPVGGGSDLIPTADPADPADD